MLLKICLLVFTSIFMVNSILAQTAPPEIEPGVSQNLARWRAANYSDVRYKLDLQFEKQSPRLKGAIEVRVKLNAVGGKTTDTIILDWRKIRGKEDLSTVSDILVNGKPAKYEEKDEHLVFKEGVAAGENTIKINFTSPILPSGAAVTRYTDKEDGAEYIYSLFVPSDASTAFPVFDQPDLKAKFSLRMVLPLDWKGISNTQGRETDKLIEDYREVGRETIKDATTITLENHRFGEIIFPETKPISTYVFAFAAGEFAEFSERDGKISGSAASEKEDFKKRKVQKQVKEIYKNWKEFDIQYRISPEQSAQMEKEKLEKLSKAADSDSQNFSRIYVRKSQAEKFKAHEKEIFRLNREGVKFLESYFDYKFPFPKYDLVLIPEFPFGGMEHAGATFLREASIIFPTEPTKNDRVSRANLIFHEAAHQWFGDTVTMKWFDDLWLKEGFAEFMAYKTLEKVMPDVNAWKIFYERNKQTAYLTDATKGTTPIYQEIANLNSAKSAYGNIVYRKAPSFLKQAEFYLGADNFQMSVRAFLKKHEFANAEWMDLVTEFEIANSNTKEPFKIKQDLRKWAESWVKQRGLFITRLVLKKSEKSNSYTIEIQSHHNLDTEAKPIMSFMNYGREPYQDTKLTFGLKLPDLELPENDISKLFKIQYFKGEPYYVFPNYQDYGYGIFLLDEKSRDYIIANIQDEKDEFLRSMMWGALWDSVREGELDPKVYIDLVIKNFETTKTMRMPVSYPTPPEKIIYAETDVGTISTLLNRTATAMTYYLSEKERAEIAPRLEEAMRKNFSFWHTPAEERLIVFRAYLNAASTAESRLYLKSILEVSRIKQAKPELRNSNQLIDIPLLRTKDHFDIAAKLLILGEPDAPKILADLEKTETSDDAKRYAYAARAGTATAENKAKFWNDFVANKEISESWIESGFVTFNSPRHADLTFPFLEKALGELPNLKRNRKIFFVNGWLAAFIGGQRSEEALKTINTFLEKNPNLDRDLRLKILENSDNLERAVKIRAKWSAGK